MDEYTFEELLKEPADKLMKRKGFGSKALYGRYDHLRILLYLLLKRVDKEGLNLFMEDSKRIGWHSEEERKDH